MPGQRRTTGECNPDTSGGAQAGEELAETLAAVIGACAESG